MAIKLTTTRESAQLNGVKILVYGAAGSGKTTLCATTGGTPLIISAEAGLLSLRQHDFAVIEVGSIEDVHEAYRFVTESADAKPFDWIVLDSVSEIAEQVLGAEKRATKDPRAAYGALSDRMQELIRAFRDLPGRNVYVSAKQERVKDDISGAMLYAPSAPGQRVGQALPYFFDEVLALRVERDPEGNPTRWLQTAADFQYVAKDRSGALDPFELPNLAAIAAKILNPTQPGA
jgi:phage nucleotide-binding protein